MLGRKDRYSLRPGAPRRRSTVDLPAELMPEWFVMSPTFQPGEGRIFLHFQNENSCLNLSVSGTGLFRITGERAVVGRNRAGKSGGKGCTWDLSATTFPFPFG